MNFLGYIVSLLRVVRMRSGNTRESRIIPVESDEVIQLNGDQEEQTQTQQVQQVSDYNQRSGQRIFWVSAPITDIEDFSSSSSFSPDSSASLYENFNFDQDEQFNDSHPQFSEYILRDLKINGLPFDEYEFINELSLRDKSEFICYFIFFDFSNDFFWDNKKLILEFLNVLESGIHGFKPVLPFDSVNHFVDFLLNDCRDLLLIRTMLKILKTCPQILAQYDFGLIPVDNLNSSFLFFSSRNLLMEFYLKMLKVDEKCARITLQLMGFSSLAQLIKYYDFYSKFNRTNRNINPNQISSIIEEITNFHLENNEINTNTSTSRNNNEEDDSTILMKYDYEYKVINILGKRIIEITPDENEGFNDNETY